LPPRLALAFPDATIRTNLPTSASAAFRPRRSGEFYV
jgi:hypothetical protein